MVMDDIEPCPFCKSDKLDISYKVATRRHYGGSMYHGTVYCKTCHSYGPRVLCYSDNYYCVSNEEKLEFNKQVVQAWNNRS